MKRILAMILAVAMVAVALTGCGRSADEKEKATERTVDIKNKTIDIGLIAPLTGSVAVYGTAVSNGVKLAVEEINKSSDILDGYTIKLSEKDDQGDPTVGTNAFTKLEEKGVAAVIGPVTTGVTSAVTAKANESGTLMITPSSTGDAVTTKSDYVFRSCIKDSYQGKMCAQYAKKLGYDKVGILYAQGDVYSKGLYDAFVSECKAQNIEVVVEQTSPTISDETTFASQLTTIIDKVGKEGFIFAPYYYEAAGGMIIPEARTQGFTGVIMGVDGYDGVAPDYVTGDAKNYENVFYTNHYSAESTDEKVTNFVTNYKAAYKDETPNAFAAMAYDATYMLATALEKVLDKTPTKVSGKELKAAMDGMQFDGVTGNFKLDKTGTPEKSVVIIGFKADSAVKNGVAAKYIETLS